MLSTRAFTPSLAQAVEGDQHGMADTLGLTVVQGGTVPVQPQRLPPPPQLIQEVGMPCGSMLFMSGLLRYLAKDSLTNYAGWQGLHWCAVRRS